LNVLEILYQKKYGEESNYSDRFLCKVSGTTEGGNQPRKVYKALKKDGTIVEQDYPFDVFTWQGYYADISPKLLSQGKKWASTHSFTYSRVGTTKEEIMTALKSSPLGIGVYAWIKDGEGYYYQPEGARSNHFCVLIGYEEGKYWKIFDTYEEEVKHLSWHYPFSYVASYTLKKKDKPYPTLRQSLLMDFLRLFTNKR